MLDIRLLTDDDLDAAWELSRLAFGGTQRERDRDRGPRIGDGAIRWGAFDEAGRLVGKAVDLTHEQWWGGRVIRASGVAGVAVQVEDRGRGVTRDVMTALLHAARERGAAVSTLFCTSTAVYRSLGYEACGVVRHVNIPTATLSRTAAGSTRLRAATGTDFRDIRAVYDEIGATTNGLLTRRGELFPDPEGVELPAGIDGITLAEDGGRVVGYASWHRGRGYDDDASVSVLDCLALTADAAQALVASIAGWGTVAPTVRFRLLPWADAVTTQLPLERAREHRADVWMHRPLDMAAAVAGRGFAAGDGAVEFRLVDPLLPWNDGAWRLTVDAGVGRLDPIDADPGTVLSVRGWSLLWCAAARSAQLRQAGLLAGSLTADRGLDALLPSGGPAGLLDYF